MIHMKFVSKGPWDGMESVWSEVLVVGSCEHNNEPRQGMSSVID
jgi:hypothetical protein